MSLQLSETFELPKEATLWAFVILAIRGAGKSYDAMKMAEQMLKLGVPIVVFDPMGIWWGLRVGVVSSGERGVDGAGQSRPGLPVLIFGGEHQDLPLPTTLSKQKREIIDEPKLRVTVNAILKAGLSVVLDTSQLSITQQTRAVGIFGDELFRKNAPYGIRHVFIEEADVYCPQKPLGDTQESHTAVDNLVRRGGNYNLGVTMITQRAAVLDKNVLSQANCLIAMRLMWEPDKKTVESWVKSHVKNEREVQKLAKWYDSLKDLKNGEAWVYSPEHNIFERVQFGERETLHASREFFLKETWEQKNISLLDVRRFVADFIQTGDTLVPKPKPSISKPSPAPTYVPHAADDRSATPTANLKEQIHATPGRPLQEAQTLPGIQQSLPTLEIHQFKPILQIPVEMQDGVTIPHGRVGVVLVNKIGVANPNRWTKKGIIEAVKLHGWSDEGIEDAINWCIRVEILRKTEDNYLWFQRDRVRVVNEPVGIGVRIN